VLPVAAAVLALLVGAGGTLLLLAGGQGSQDRDDQLAVQPSPAETPPPVPEAPPEPPAPPPGGPVTFEGIGLELPPGWLLEDDGAGTGCVTRTPGACELRVLLVPVARERSDVEFQTPEPDAPLGWYLGTDVPGCEAGNAQGRLVVRELRAVDDKQAAYREWDVTCGGDPHVPARPRLWWLPKTLLAFLDESDDESVDPVLDEIVRTADLGAVAR